MNTSISEHFSAAKSFDVCVLIPVFNNLSGLLTSLKSIVYEPEKLCVVIVDDGSDVPVDLKKIFSESGNGFKIYGVLLSENSGITTALNAGLAWIEENLQVKYIARLDCGDHCHEKRFFKQVQFLETHPEVGLLGSWVVFEAPETGFHYQYKTPTEHQEIVREMYFRNVFIHPTVMFRANLLEQTVFYPVNYRHVEDYAFFMEFLKQTKAAVLPEFLVTCEINPQGISMKNRLAQLKGRAKVVEDYGKNPAFKLLGKLKMKLLEMVPYKVILKLKKR